MLLIVTGFVLVANAVLGQPACVVHKFFLHLLEVPLHVVLFHVLLAYVKLHARVVAVLPRLLEVLPVEVEILVEVLTALESEVTRSLNAVLPNDTLGSLKVERLVVAVSALVMDDSEVGIVFR